MAICLLVLVLAPVVTVVGYETLGHRHMAERSSGSNAVDAAEHRFDVDDRSAVERLEVVHADARAVDLRDADAVEPDRVRAIRRARGEHAVLAAAHVAARVHAQHVAARAIEPGEHEQIFAGRDALPSPPATLASNTSHASGAPSSPCLGASARSLSGDSTMPIGCSSRVMTVRPADPRACPAGAGSMPHRASVRPCTRSERYDADELEPERAVQADAGVVGQGHARHRRREAARREPLEQRLVQLTSGAGAVAPALHVHADLARPPVRLALLVGAPVGVADDLSAVLEHEPVMVLECRDDAAGHLLRRRRLGLERDRGLGHVRRVDRGAGRGIGGGRGANWHVADSKEIALGRRFG